MPVLTPTKALGAQVRPMEGTYAEPGQQISDNELDMFLPGSGMNGGFLADLMSAMVTHERCGRHLYRSVAGRTNNPMLRRRYQEFGEQTERHFEILEALITAAGGNPCYVSPQARVTQGLDTKLVESTFALGGGVDVMTQEMAMLDAVFLAETIDHANWSTLSKLTDSMADGELRDRFRAAVAEVEEEEDEHLDWAATTKQRMVMLQAEHGAVATMTAKAEELLARVRGWFDDAG
jgi:demethoxyubiquinone hydroxylase (CLK1/Coq7/Cat5 family)